MFRMEVMKGEVEDLKGRVCEKVNMVIYSTSEEVRNCSLHVIFVEGALCMGVM
jgi:hypothetical protein